MQNKLLLTLIFTQLVFICSCGNTENAQADNTVTPPSTTSSNDTLSNQLQCNISIDGKKFTVPADSIFTSYTFSDSSLGLSFNGINEGRLILTIPNIFKCPCNIPTGYSSIRFKIAGSDEYSVEPTVELYSYPVAGISFRNLNDGYHKKDVAQNAAVISSIQKTNENTDTKWAEYLIKGKIHTTVLKNVFESAAGENNKDYTVNGEFVIQTRINY